ncbi:MAG: serine hydrolase [Marinilabiliales bacterium]|nr:MAG: serine hydrolase [Marinilabiliales bacterium]
MKKHIYILAVLFLSSTFISSISAQQDTELIQKIDSLSSAVFTSWSCPGMAVAVVKDGEVIFKKGYGVSDVNTQGKVDANTLFAVASITKTFTSTSLMMLQEQKALSVDDKVVKYIHDFQLYDPYVTQNMTIRDLLCHRSGLKTFSGDLIWYGTDYSRNEVIRRARYLKPEYGFREHFGYSNILFLTAGQIIPAVCDTSWDRFLKYRIFGPLGMNRTITSTNDLRRLGNYASPHNILDNSTIMAIPWQNWDNIGPAGSIISSVNDMSKWIIMQLNQGTYKGKQFFDPESQQEMWSLHTPTQVSEFSRYYWPDIHFKGYGLGWSLSDYGGRKIVAHNGGYDGMISQCVLIPEENMGFIVLTNANSWLYMPMMYSLLDALLKDKIEDWNELFIKIKKRQDAADNDAKEEFYNSKVEKAPPSLALEEYTGIYHCDIYGDVRVFMSKNELWLDMTHTKIFSGKLTHFHYNTFLIEFKSVPSLPVGTVTFYINSEGLAESLEIFVDNPDFDFTEFDFRRNF